ncbi:MULTISPECIES: glycosyltransferase [Chitinophagaceae]
MKITYFFRHPEVGFSIQKVFSIIVSEVNKHATSEIVEMPSKGSMPWDIVRNCICTFKNRNKKGINHVTGHIHDVILALVGCKSVLTVHDLVFLDNVKNPIKRFYKWLFWLYLPIKLADKVVCISSETQRKIIQHINTHKTMVIFDPIDTGFEYLPRSFHKEKPVILHIGTGWNKNLKRTIEALEGISCHLRIVGKLKPEILDLLKVKKIDYSNAFNLTDEEIKQEYIHCDIVNFPSEYEGFGMPIIEGQQTGRIVITSRIEPLIEVSNNAVWYVDPQSVTSLRAAYLGVILNKEKREELIRMGRENVKRFSANLIAEQYLKLYKEILHER